MFEISSTLNNYNIIKNCLEARRVPGSNKFHGRYRRVEYALNRLVSLNIFISSDNI